MPRLDHVSLILDALTRRDGDLLGALLRAHLKAGWHVARGTVPDLAVAPSAEASAT